MTDSAATAAPSGAALIASLFEGEEGLDDTFLAVLAGAGAEDRPPSSDEELEALMREQWGLPQINAEAEIARVEGGQSVRPDDRDEDDYTDEEWCVVRVLRKYCLDAVQMTTPHRQRKKAVQWIFARGEQDARHGIEFHLACDMLRARPWVIHALIQHLWFLRGIRVEALPLMSDPLPEALQSEAILRAWNEGMLIVDSLWRRPGIAIEALRNMVPEVSDADYDRALDQLIHGGIVGLNNGAAFVTSRPATFRRKRGNVSWARSFVGD